LKHFETSAIFLLFSGLGCRIATFRGFESLFYCRIATFQGFESLFIAGLRRSGASKAFLLPDCGVPGLRKPFYCRIATFQGFESLFVAGLRRSRASKAFFIVGLRRSGSSKAFFVVGLRRSGSSNVVWLSDMPFFLFRNGGCGEDVLRLPGGLRWEVVELLVTFYIILPQDGVGLSSVVGIGLGYRFA